MSLFVGTLCYQRKLWLLLAIQLFLCLLVSSSTWNIPRETIYSARCISRCLQYHGTVPNQSQDSSSYVEPSLALYRSLDCSSQSCHECRQPCLSHLISRQFCHKNCLSKTASICSTSCDFLYDIAEGVSISYDQWFDSLDISNLNVVCEDPFNSDVQSFGVTMYLGWSLHIKNKTESIRNCYSVSYILLIESPDGSQRISSPTIGELFHISGLQPNSTFKLKLVGVLENGALIKSNILYYKTFSVNSKTTVVTPTSISVLGPNREFGKTVFYNILWESKSCWNRVDVVPFSTNKNSNLFSNSISFLAEPGIDHIHFGGLYYGLSYQVSVTPTNSHQNMTGHSLLKRFNVPNCENLTKELNLQEIYCVEPTAPTAQDTGFESSWVELFIKKKDDIIITRNTVGPSYEKETPLFSRNNESPNISFLVWFLPLIMLIFIVSGISYIVWKLRRANTSAKTVLYLTKNPAYSKELAVSFNSNKVDCSSTDLLEVSPNDFIIEQDLGEGEFGMVFRARVQPKSTLSSRLPGRIHVAIKLLKVASGDTEQAQFLREIDIMKKVTHHPNVLGLLGYCTQYSQLVYSSFPLCLITELCPRGDLKRHLDFLRAQGDSRNTPLVTRDQQLCWTVQIVAGMCHLATCGMVHRDLAARNVLIGEGSQLKIADFGLCRDICKSSDSQYHQTTGGRLPYRWLAPECLTHQVYSIHSDVWAFGVLLWEILTLGATPYESLSLIQVSQLLESGKRLGKPAGCPLELSDILTACWKRDPDSRPAFPEILVRLQKLITVSQQRNYLPILSGTGGGRCSSDSNGGSSMASSASASDHTNSSCRYAQFTPVSNLY